jgi:hypothetical protein
MRTRISVATRFALVVFLLCALVSGQTASLVSEQLHQHASHHCCGVCHAGMPFVQTAVSAGETPACPRFWLETPHTAEYPHEVLPCAGPSRAPPVSFPR